MSEQEKNPRIQTFIDDMGLAIKHKVIDNKELGQLALALEKNDKYALKIEEKRAKWQEDINKTIKVLKVKFELLKPADILDAQGYALMYRQEIAQEISRELIKRTQFSTRLDVIKQNKLLYYSLEYAAKATNTEKLALIEGHITEFNRRLYMIDTYVDFLNSSIKTLDSLLYGVKNVIDLLNYTSGK